MQHDMKLHCMGKTYLILNANTKVTDQPVFPRSLGGAVVRHTYSVIDKRKNLSVQSV